MIPLCCLAQQQLVGRLCTRRSLEAAWSADPCAADADAGGVGVDCSSPVVVVVAFDHSSRRLLRCCLRLLLVSCFGLLLAAGTQMLALCADVGGL